MVRELEVQLSKAEGDKYCPICRHRLAEHMVDWPTMEYANYEGNDICAVAIRIGSMHCLCRYLVDCLREED